MGKKWTAARRRHFQAAIAERRAARKIMPNLADTARRVGPGDGRADFGKGMRRTQMHKAYRGGRKTAPEPSIIPLNLTKGEQLKALLDGLTLSDIAALRKYPAEQNRLLVSVRNLAELLAV